MKIITSLYLATILIACMATAESAELPTIHQVYAAAKSGHLAQAQQMMSQVLAVHPDSAKAHFVEAEILLAQHQYAGAKTALNKAEQLAPGLPFEKPQALQSLQYRIEQGLQGSGTFKRVSTNHTSSGISFGTILLIAVAIMLLIFVIRAVMRPRTLPATYTGGISPNNQMGSTPGMGPVTQVTPSTGGGFMSAVTTGLGVGAGIAAGEALVEHFTHGQNANAVTNNSVPDQFTQPYDDQLASNDLGGNDFGLADDSSWNDDSVAGDFSDFGGGGDDWS